MCVAASTKSSSVAVVDGGGQRSGPLRRRQSFHYAVSALLIRRVEQLVTFVNRLSDVHKCSEKLIEEMSTFLLEVHCEHL